MTLKWQHPMTATPRATVDVSAVEIVPPPPSHDPLIEFAERLNKLGQELRAPMFFDSSVNTYELPRVDRGGLRARPRRATIAEHLRELRRVARS